MGPCTLRPPNFDQLSDDAIRGFVQQKRFRRDWFVDNEPVNAKGVVFSPPSQIHIVGMYNTGSRIKQVEGERLERQTDHQNGIESLKNQATSQIEELLVPQTTTTVDAYRRELRRKKQLRHRKKQSDRMLHLNKDNHKLEADIAKLKARLSTPPRNVWSSAVQFIQVFRRSLNNVEIPADKATFNSKMIVDAPDVLFNGERGIGMMVQSLKRVSLWFDRPEFETRYFVERSANSLEATSILSITITEKTLSHVFPHLCAEKYGAFLGSRLLGQRIAVRMETRFEWDTMHGRISSVVTKSDLMQPMLDLLGNLEGVSLVFDKAAMSLDLQWK